jgi:hypothetical protein
MLIDWFTVGAQVLNFLILVWLLKRFLYKPILDAIDAREQRIAAELADADAKRPRPKGARRVPAQERGVRRAARGALEQATDEAKTERQRLSTKRGRPPTPCVPSGRRRCETNNRSAQSGHHPPDPAGGLRHRAQGADGSRRASLEERMARCSSRACESNGRRGASRARQGPEDIVRPGARAQRV